MAKNIKNSDEYTKCTKCNSFVKNKNLKKHARNHKKADQVKANARPRLCDMSSSDRKKWLVSLDRPDKEFSKDIFSRGKVLNGGSYGLGKSRKH
jgi:predicted ATP-dependent serine protease